jgi:hypothetical protein
MAQAVASRNKLNYNLLKIKFSKTLGHLNFNRNYMKKYAFCYNIFNFHFNLAKI